jgi:hypothetical protein
MAVEAHADEIARLIESEARGQAAKTLFRLTRQPVRDPTVPYEQRPNSGTLFRNRTKGINSPTLETLVRPNHPGR